MQTTHHTTVTARLALTARMTRLTLSGPTLLGLPVRPAQDIELLLPDGQGATVKRRYTVRHARPDRGEIDIDVFHHAYPGPGDDWARGARVGTTAQFRGPKGKLELRPAHWYLFLGDEASLPAIAALAEALGPEPTSVVLAEIRDHEDEIPIAHARTQWLHRGDASPGTPDLLAKALESLPAPAGSGRAFLLGESRTVNTLRTYLGAHGIDAEHTFVKGYWNA